MSRPHLRDVRALTLLNPWAHLIAHYGKDVENRSWMPHRGVTQILIHAGKGWDYGAGHWLRPTADLGDPEVSAIVAVADIAHACNSSRWSSTVVCDCGEWAMPGQCHWRLGDVWALPKPVCDVGGMQGLWRPSPGLVDAVRSQYYPAGVA